MSHALQVEELNIKLKTKSGTLDAVNDLSFSVDERKLLGIIGESGCGKSISCMASIGLLSGNQWDYDGKVLLNGKDLRIRDEKQMRQIRGKEVAIIMQNPMNAFNPSISIRKHFEETMTAHSEMNGKETREAAMEMLHQMRIKDPESVYDSYPFECSGGMLQRVMIAIALMLKPKVLIADEPTTSLDRTVQNEIIKLLDHIRYDHDAGIIFVSHDLHVITGIADDITVMYSGYSVEQAPKDVIVHAPRHPYTRGLFRSRPNYSRERLVEIPGQPPTLKERNCQEGCLFLGRCPYRTEACEQYDMGPVKLDDRHTVRCCRCGEIE